jgi:hypothetical protein
MPYGRKLRQTNLQERRNFKLIGITKVIIERAEGPSDDPTMQKRTFSGRDAEQKAKGLKPSLVIGPSASVSCANGGSRRGYIT